MTSGTYFLSYSRSDEAFALRFAGDLRAAGVDMWVDQVNIRPSEHWDRAIERAVRDSSGIIVVLSPRSVASDNVADEISFAIDSGKKVLPVLIERCSVPLRITRMQMIDATGDYDRALQQCLSEIGEGSVAPAAPPAPAPRPAPAPPATIAPDAIDKAASALLAYLGPIAPMVAKRQARGSVSADDLHQRLAALIPAERDRAAFLQRLRA